MTDQQPTSGNRLGLPTRSTDSHGRTDGRTDEEATHLPTDSSPNASRAGGLEDSPSKATEAGDSVAAPSDWKADFRRYVADEWPVFESILSLCDHRPWVPECEMCQLRARFGADHLDALFRHAYFGETK